MNILLAPFYLYFGVLMATIMQAGAHKAPRWYVNTCIIIAIIWAIGVPMLVGWILWMVFSL